MILKITFRLFLYFLFICQSGVFSYVLAADKAQGTSTKHSVVKNHEFVRVITNQTNSDGTYCQFEGDGENFCDEAHIAAIKAAIKSRKPDFFEKFIIVTAPSSATVAGLNVMAIDRTTGLVYPLPFEAMTPLWQNKSLYHGLLRLLYNNKENHICVTGETALQLTADTWDTYDYPCFEFTENSYHSIVGFDHTGELDDANHQHLKSILKVHNP